MICLFRVWDLEGNETMSFSLRSPGVSVCWHPEEVYKVNRGFLHSKKGFVHRIFMNLQLLHINIVLNVQLHK